uniref:Uncharacterized protein n=1 Tax=Plectus sambesii TaxID=2011161 RepID=A0A914W7K2_9BILA
MSHRQIATIFNQKKALANCFTNVAKYSTASQRTRNVDKNIAFDPSSSAQKAREATVFAREQYTGDIKNRSPVHSPSIIKPTLEEIERDSKGANASAAETHHHDGTSPSGIETLQQENKAEEAYWEQMKTEHKEISNFAKKEPEFSDK